MGRDTREDDLHDLIVEASDRTELWDDVLTALIEQSGSAAGALYIQYEPSAARSSPILTEVIPFQGFGSGMMERYTEHYHALNPFHAYGDRFAPGRVMTDESLKEISRDFDLGNTEFFVDWCRPQNFGYAMGEILLKNGAPLTLWLNRSIKAGPYDLREQTRFHRLARSTLFAIRTAERLHEARHELQALHQALENQGVAALSLDRLGRVRTLNATAERALREEDGLRLRNGRLEAVDPVDNSALGHLLRLTASPLRGIVSPDATLPIRRARDQPPLQLSLAAMRGRKDALRFDEADTMAVVFRYTPSESVLDVARLETRFRLTPSEIRLAAVLRDGTALPAAAKRVGVGYETARSQLKAIFAKTGTQRQAELVSLLSTYVTHSPI